MRTITGDINKAKELVSWFDSNHHRNSKSDMRPSYGSWANDTVRWDSNDGSWYVSCYPRKNIVEFECNDIDLELMIAVKFI